LLRTITEEVWRKMGHTQSVTQAVFPKYDEKYLKEDNITYPVAFNGKRRYEIQVPANADNATVEKMALEHELAAKWLDGKTPTKVIVVPKRMVNIVIK